MNYILQRPRQARRTRPVAAGASPPFWFSRQSSRHGIHKEPSIMKHRSNARRQGGFTLVEIAIVLMIVGLLIGGILRGQELIQSARVRNIIDQKSAIQTAYIGFMDRYRMLPGDLTVAQAAVVGNGAISSNALISGDGLIAWNFESVTFFQNLTAAGFISCGGCMTVAAPAAAAINNSPVNVYGNFIWIGTIASDNTVAFNPSFFDPISGIVRMQLTTGASIPSQVLAEVDRKADDGFPGSGQLRVGLANGASAVGVCAPGLAVATPAVAWANPNQTNCAGAWLF
jgi:prepilin-type N-terminal cleavage/methylation domain-containing protein